MFFSVIVPVYKVEGYLQSCIESVLNQTFSDFELILVDDGSPDKCPEICDEYAKQEPQLVRVLHQPNAGAGAARNRALDIAQGELFCGECRAKREVFGDGVRMDDDAPRHEWVLLAQGALEAIRFAISTPLGKMMSFRLDDEADRYDFSRAGEKFVRYHLDVDSAALKMYEQMRGK